jgi:hypothetical protein
VLASTHESIVNGRHLYAIDLDFAPSALLTAGNLAPVSSSMCLDACLARTSGLRLNTLLELHPRMYPRRGGPFALFHFGPRRAPPIDFDVCLPGTI